MIALGPFDLIEPLGRGGMGVVWRAVHRDWRRPVAVKLLTGERTQDPDYVEAFRNEVRAVAGLDHPHIVLVYDHGLVSAATAAASGGRLAAGTPWLAMELAERGALTRHRVEGWSGTRALLLALLDALAHAHARGVVHRDIKPGNVLVGGERPGVKLTDFGMATHVERLTSGQALFLGGTPAYMAPEQVECRWRDFGPWTDLYAVGCLAWALCTGSPPFGREHAVEAHLTQPVPRLEPRFAVPDGVEGWLRALLEKDEARRVQRAADAAWALLELPEGTEAPAEALGDDDTAAVAGLRTTLVWPSGTSGPRGWSNPEPPRPRPAREARAALPPPPLPTTWRRAPRPITPGLRGAGLGLWGLRQIPMIDREAERDALWTALGKVRHDGRPRAMVLQGPAGFGKSRLAGWLCERADEVGSATVLEAGHAPVAGPGDGLRGLLVRHLRLGGLPAEEVRERVAAGMARLGERDPDEVAAVLALLEAPGGRVVQLRSPTERFAVLARLLVRRAADRPVLLWLDDVQWGLEALQFARFVLELDAPVLIVVTAREEALPDRPAEAAALDALLSRPRAGRLPIGPLPPEHQRLLVRALGLEGPIAAEVEARTHGNPLFAVHLVGDWVERGLLEPGEQGFRVAPGAELAMPGDLHQVWSDRIARVLEGRPEQDRRALEIAAVLGLQVDGTEWRATCALAGVRAPTDLVEHLLAWRLATSGREGPSVRWSFVHGMLRESLEREAAEAGRVVGHRRACAAMLRARTGADVVERLGRMLLAAGELEEAVDPLLEAAQRRAARADYGIGAQLVEDRERALEALGVPETDPRRLDGWVLASSLELRWGDIARSQLLGERAVRVARRIEDAERLSAALCQLGRVLRRRGDVDRATQLFEEAERLSLGRDDAAGLAAARSELGWILLRRGKVAEARRCAALALEDYRRGQPLGLSAAHMQLGEIARQAGDLGEAEHQLETARRRFEADGLRWGVASATNALGELMRVKGDLERAEACYRESYERYAALGDTDAAFPEANLGLVLVEAGRYEEAGRVLDSCLARATAADLWRLVVGVQAALLACCAARGQWRRLDRLLREVVAMARESKLVDSDTARFAHQAADLALAAGDAGRARALYSLARDQWRALRRHDEARRAEEALLQLA